MKTQLAVGDYFRWRHRCEFDYGRVVINENEKQYELLSWQDIPLGAVVHNAIWSDHYTLESRGTFVFKGKRKGDREVN